jgi:RNA polymerase sigma-70 factor (ECF subfamily)
MGNPDASSPTTEVVAERMDTSTALQRLGQSPDPEAWRAILDAHGMAILNLARRITGDATLAEDVCQETLLQIRADAARYQPMGEGPGVEASARGWIMRIACHTASKMLRRRDGARRREARAAAVGVASVPSAAEAALSREQAELVRHEVTGLSGPLREAVCLHYYAGLPYADLAATLACSAEAAKKRVQRGVERLRKRLVSRGLVLGLGALTAQLAGGVAEAAQATAATATTATAVAFEVQRQATWQALLNSSQQAAFSYAAQFGGAALMSKTSLMIAGVAVFCLTGVTSYFISDAKDETQRAQTAALEQNVTQLQQELTSARKELEPLRAGLADLKDQNLALKMQVAETQDKLASFNGERGGHMRDAIAWKADAKGMPPEVAMMVKGMLKDAHVKLDVDGVKELIELGVEPEDLQEGDEEKAEVTEGDGVTKKGGLQVKRFKLPGGGEGKIVTHMMVLGEDGEVQVGPEGKVQIHGFDIGDGEGRGEVVIRLDGHRKAEKKAAPPPKIKDDF